MGKPPLLAARRGSVRYELGDLHEVKTMMDHEAFTTANRHSPGSIGGFMYHVSGTHQLTGDDHRCTTDTDSSTHSQPTRCWVMPELLRLCRLLKSWRPWMISLSCRKKKSRSRERRSLNLEFRDYATEHLEEIRQALHSCTTNNCADVGKACIYLHLYTSVDMDRHKAVDTAQASFKLHWVSHRFCRDVSVLLRPWSCLMLVKRYHEHPYTGCWLPVSFLYWNKI